MTESPSTTIGAIVDTLSHRRLPFFFTAYDGSSSGPSDSAIRIHLASERGVRYIAASPNSLGLARAYIMGDIEVTGVSPADPYDLFKVCADRLKLSRPSPATVAQLVRTLGIDLLRTPPIPPQEQMPRWRRVAEGLRHSTGRDARSIQHHYDVSNDFYELVLGPAMTYTCACYPQADASLEQAQEHKHALVFGKLGLRPGMRLLDVGCGWGGMVRFAARRGVRALGVTLSAQQAAWGRAAIEREGLGDLAEIRHLDYRDVSQGGFDAISSIGLTEHIGVHNYPAYFAFLRDRLRPGGRLLNHCITRPTSVGRTKAKSFIDRYVFPDGELTSSGRIISTMQNVGIEVRHEESLREHYAMTLRDWCANLATNWRQCVDLVGVGTAKVWGLYMAGSRLGFERNEIQLHQVLGVRTADGGDAGFELRPDWGV